VDQWAFGPRDETIARKYARQLKSRESIQDTFAKDIAEDPNEDPAEDLNREEALEQEQSANSLSDKERRERLPAFWYNLINARLCIRKWFLDFFDEPKDGDNPTQKERCCSHCNPEFALEDLDRYYLYSEKGPSYNKKRKLIAEDLEQWAWYKCHEVPRKDNFLPNASYILTKSQRIELARYAHQTLKKEDLLSKLGSWRWYDQFGQNLYEELRKAYNTRESSSQTPARQLGQYTNLIQYSWRSNAYQAVLTANIQTPAKNPRISLCLHRLISTRCPKII
jgi:hypothetical protein